MGCRNDQFLRSNIKRHQYLLSRNHKYGGLTLSFSFNGTSSTLELGTALLDTTTPITLACRFKPASLVVAQRLMSISLTPTTFGDYFAMTVSTTGTVQAQTVATIGSINTSCISSNTAQLNRWSNAVAIFSSSTSRQIVLDGVAQVPDG